ncbi:hypothetical protein E3U55_10100 [Filobacillus milosensis]|uniref:Uncharacterized protein n=1 Tax=Filobacillus milosensis TaxID=94137 RepID=A0A4Y8IFW9_9BACI|nr:hypothetical protein [Filobacillus milosensis]TFB19507.1 hypothetical protein E3U55_10100 [Filobacillus milosensis]
MKKHNWKKILLITFTALIVFLIADKLFIQNQQIIQLENKTSKAEQKLLFSYNAFPIEYAFERVQEDPTDDNLKLLFSTLLNQQKKIETLIELNKEDINETMWEEYISIPTTQAVIFPLNLAEFEDGINQSHLNKLKEIESAWLKYEENSKGHMTSYYIDNIGFLLKNYIELLKKLNKIPVSLQ